MSFESITQSDYEKLKSAVQRLKKKGIPSTVILTPSTSNIPAVTNTPVIDLLVYGDGSDGSPILDGINKFDFATLAGTTYTMTRRVQAKDFTINSTITLVPAGFIISGTGTFLNNGTINEAGNGGAGGTGVTAQAVGNPGTSGATLASNLRAGGGGGSGGNANGFGTSGAGGAGGRSVYISFPFIYNNGSITVKGNNGGNSTAAQNLGGGGGGGGGEIYFIYRNTLESGNTTITGGTAGTGATGGAGVAKAGGAGGSGYGAGGAGGVNAAGSAGTNGNSGGGGGGGGPTGAAGFSGGAGGNGAVVTKVV